MKKGDVLLYSGRGFLAHMIRVVTKSRWSHAAWVLAEGTLLESDWELFGAKGVQIEPVKTYPSKRRVLLRPNLPDAVLEQAVDLALKKAGQKYDWGLFLSLLWNWFLCACTFWRKKRGHNRKRAWICSELVATPLFQIAEFRFVDDVPVGNIVPEDLWRSVVNGRSKIVEP